MFAYSLEETGVKHQVYAPNLSITIGWHLRNKNDEVAPKIFLMFV